MQNGDKPLPAESEDALYRVAIVDDDPVVREHFSDIVNAAPELILDGAVGSLAAADALIAEAPDLILLDIGLPDGSGLDFIPRIKSGCDARILVVSSFGDRETVVSAIAAGADGYLLKDSGPSAVRDGIEATLTGGAPISASAAVYLLERLRAPVETTPPSTEGPLLSQRETELLKLFAKGCSYKEAARLLEISPLTVGNHVKSIYRKLAVNSRGEAVFEAISAGHIEI
jgi:DNA-binding NarL/FixJ family response regulator